MREYGICARSKCLATKFSVRVQHEKMMLGLVSVIYVILIVSHHLPLGLIQVLLYVGDECIHLGGETSNTEVMSIVKLPVV